MKPRTIAGRIAFAVGYTAFLICFVLTFHYIFFWRSYSATMQSRVKSARERRLPKVLGPDLQRNLGSFRNDKDSSFLRFQRRKASGVTRVCALGDSYTMGDEVDRHQDYPTLLKHLLDARGHRSIEVLNFGSGWHGFHQTFLLWDRLGRTFGCDYLLLGPGGFFRDRDVTFNHTIMRDPSYIHARYVLAGDDVQLMPTIGGTQRQRIDNFLRFFPPWQYWRYDRNPPPVVLAALPPLHTVPNPFYYYEGSLEAEALATYRILWRKLAAGGSRILLVHNDDELRAAASGLEIPNLAAFPEVHSYAFPYLAPKGHRSAFGNRLVAEHFYAQITGELDHELVLLTTTDLHPQPRSAEISSEPQPLHAYDAVTVMLDDEAIGVFVDAEKGLLQPSRRKSTLRAEKVVALFALDDDQKTLPDACYIPIAFPLRRGMEVALVERAADGSVARQRLSPVETIAERVNIGFSANAAIHCTCRTKMVCEVAAPGAQFDGGEVSLLVNDVEVMGGTRAGNSVSLKAISGRVRRLTAGRPGYRDVDALPESGTFDLVLFRKRRPSLRAPLVAWSKARYSIPSALGANTTLR